jgi:hypothetical protein
MEAYNQRKISNSKTEFYIIEQITLKSNRLKSHEST